MKILITGDSHTGALNRGWNKINGPDEKGSLDIKIQPLGTGAHLNTKFFEEKNGAAIITNEAYKKNFVEFPLRRGEYIYGFSAPFHTIRVLRDIDWISNAPVHVVQNEAPITSSLLKQIFYNDQKYLLSFFDLLLKKQERLFVIEAPLLFRHNPIFRKGREDVLLYIDREYRSYIRTELENRNIHVIRVPDLCFDAQGYMRERYRHPSAQDPHHGNAEFGEIMMKEVMNYLVSAR
jgi:hypothetical protein